ncbi:MULTISPECIES: Stf0 family sulfotransferase [Sinorhizobium]|uniref:Stf0 family sulfotransferase n=1 Tax=Sinorhizobium TaxID=28105 RepID=UPI000BE7AE00|nr:MULTISPECIES: Stf0 family sulfotransferase [Sinorhizobium]PDT54681.1 LpsS [Sinorhizobium sp. NG07B]POH31727.1 LpsS [Sinorhizobium americanum]
MRGYLLLTEARSGSNWLGSLINGSGNMGRSSEWLSPKIHRLDAGSLSWEVFFDQIIRKSSSDNGNFGLKIFPNHLFVTREKYGMDFIQYCLSVHDVALIFLRRKDTLRQAISYARARQTRSFAAHIESKAEPQYDFEEIAKCFFYIRDSNSFWQSYLELTGAKFTEFVYEELVADPTPFVTCVAEHLRVPPPIELQTSMAVQRDDLTDEWVARFNKDRRSAHLLDAYDRREHIPGKIKNFFKLATRSLEPRHPFAF